jgi:hypothetical protein
MTRRAKTASLSLSLQDASITAAVELLGGYAILLIPFGFRTWVCNREPQFQTEALRVSNKRSPTKANLDRKTDMPITIMACCHSS